MDSPLVKKSDQDRRTSILAHDLAAIKDKLAAMVKGLVKVTVTEEGVTSKQDPSPKETLTRDPFPEPVVSEGEEISQHGEALLDQLVLSAEENGLKVTSASKG